jgi:hypothetical protein
MRLTVSGQVAAAVQLPHYIDWGNELARLMSVVMVRSVPVAEALKIIALQCAYADVSGLRPPSMVRQALSIGHGCCAMRA